MGAKLIVFVVVLYFVVQCKNAMEVEEDVSKSGLQLKNIIKEVVSTNEMYLNTPKYVMPLTAKILDRYETNYVDPKNVISTFSSNLFLIFPGTKWCGAGNIAQGYNDLGFFWHVDTCCREHDQCPDFIPSSSSKYGLTNSGRIVKLLCSCDEQLYRCLKAVGSNVARDVGNIYFNVLGNQCFKEDYPIVRCKSNFLSIHYTRCKEYELNISQPKKYQFFDVPLYK